MGGNIGDGGGGVRPRSSRKNKKFDEKLNFRQFFFLSIYYYHYYYYVRFMYS
jgi:hypothetical protein